MPRVNHVKSARKNQGKCRCGKRLGVGSPYLWWKFRFGGRHVRCTKPKCAPKGSELTQSEIKGGCYAAQENVADELEALSNDCTVDELETIRDEAAQNVQEVVDLLQEKLDAIEEGTGHTGTPVYQELEERHGEVESWHSEIEDAEFEEWEADEADEDDEDLDDEEKKGAEQDSRDGWLQDQCDILTSAMDSCPE